MLDFGTSFKYLTEANHYFTKRFEFKKDLTKNCWSLPDESFFCSQSPQKQIPKLRELKESLNLVKSKLNDFPIEKWSVHTRSRNPCQAIIPKLKAEVNAEFVTQVGPKQFHKINRICIFPVFRLSVSSTNAFTHSN